MIQPGFATMLCFVQTDAVVPDPERALRGAVAQSFERISVDGQMSTNDAVALQATGASGEELPEGLLCAVLEQLALEIVSDGEGATRVCRVEVRGAASPAEAEGVARAIANSPLVKTALHGADPNWGRIAQSIGLANPGAAPLAFDIAIQGVPVARGGAAVPHDSAALNEAVAASEVDYEVTLPGEGADAEVLFSDFGHEYVRINAEYTT
jgi:glutamate N-acetyltransferase/amino-acid N-acetyltransferase